MLGKEGRGGGGETQAFTRKVTCSAGGEGEGVVGRGVG